jgi:AcrR family transcriptional regulator/predicted RNA-binding Zn ribbon-like protein
MAHPFTGASPNRTNKPVGSILIVVSPARRPPTRTRILDAADRLFGEHGIRAVGVEAIVAAADTAKTTLYAHFGSKDGLVVAYLQRRAAERQVRLERALALHRGSPVERVLLLYDLLAVEVGEPGYRGSPFANARVELGAEHPAAAVAREHSQWLLDAFTGLATEAAAPDPPALAAQLLLLYEAALQGGDAAARTAKTAAEGLLTALTAQPAPTLRATTRLPPGGSAEAQRLVAFLNSAHLPDGDDQLTDDRAGPWIAGWLADASRPAPVALVGQPAMAAAAAELLVVREGLRELAAVNCGDQADPHRVAQAVAQLERTPLLVELASGPKPRLTPATGEDRFGHVDHAVAGADPTTATAHRADPTTATAHRADPTTATAHRADHAAAEAARLVIAVVACDYLAVRARDEWSRIKVCGSPDCRWAFVDGTRNRSRRWCDMAGCGNRAKNRAWRHRQTPVTS